MKFKLINTKTGKDPLFPERKIAEFLHEHLGHYGDPVEDILKCIDYVFTHGRGGNIVLALDDEDQLIGAVILNNTGMSGYIPENILVYIAIDKNQRGKGLGSKLMEQAVNATEGNIALHVDADNPALRLYERLGFENKYLEMRLNVKNFSIPTKS